MLKMFSSQFTHSFVKLLVKIGTTLLIGPAEYLLQFMRFLIQKLFWASDEEVK